MKIETDRLVLRRFSEKDLMDLFEYLSDPDVVKFEPYRPMSLEKVREELELRIESEEMVPVALKSSGKLIGNIYLGKRENNALEIGFVFNKDYWKQGYARESCAVMICEEFSNGIDRILAHCDPENQSSWSLLEKLGFSRTAHLEKMSISGKTIRVSRFGKIPISTYWKERKAKVRQRKLLTASPDKSFQIKKAVASSNCFF